MIDMSAEIVHGGAPQAGPRGAEVDDTIRRAVKALIHGRDVKTDAVADAIGISRATLYNRLRGRGRQQAFQAGEVADLAAYFGLRVDDLYSGLGGRFTPGAQSSINSGCSSPSLADVINLPAFAQTRRQRESDQRVA